MNECQYQRRIIRRIYREYPEVVVVRTNPQLQQGIPDLIVLSRRNWVALELKRSRTARHRPNQSYWLDRLGLIGFARFLYPENEQEVFNEIQTLFT